jgi:hypothetical protein
MSKLQSVKIKSFKLRRIAALGTAFIPDPEIYCELPDFGQVYRRGSIFMRAGDGITLGRNVAVKFTGDTDYDRFLLHHETGHLSQINAMGAARFYMRTAKEYLIPPGFYNTYTTPGTLEYAAEYYAYSKLGYTTAYIPGRGFVVSYNFPFSFY